jgi:hypothetical protein
MKLLTVLKTFAIKNIVVIIKGVFPSLNIIIFSSFDENK